MPTVFLDVDALLAAVDAKRRARNLSWRAVAKETVLAPALFTRLKGGEAKLDVDAMLTLCRWIPADPADFGITRQTHPNPTPIVFIPRGIPRSKLKALAALAEAAELIVRDHHE